MRGVAGTDATGQLKPRKARPVRELAAYLAAGLGYVAIGVVEPAFLFSWVVAAGYLLLVLWLLPALVRRVLS